MYHDTYWSAILAFCGANTPLQVLYVLFALGLALAAAYGLFLTAYYLLRGSYRALRRSDQQQNMLRERAASAKNEEAEEAEDEAANDEKIEKTEGGKTQT